MKYLTNKSSLLVLLGWSSIFSCIHEASGTNLILKNEKNTAVPISSFYGNPIDPHIKYYGRWDFSDSSNYRSAWGGAYFKVGFTGTSIKIQLGNASSYYVKIDQGPWTKFQSVEGINKLNDFPLKKGKHNLSVAQGKDYDYRFDFKGIILDKKGITFTPDTSPVLIEYIGDSITAGYTDPQVNISSYGWVCSEMMGVEHSQIAYPGICLTSGYPNPGMDTFYFKQKSLAHLQSNDWNFSTYTPDILVINLGTNDSNKRVPDSLFRESYTTFLQQIRKKFPRASLFVMQTFKDVKTAPTLAAIETRKSEGDEKLYYISTKGWLTEASDFTDGLHPSVSGNIKIAKKLKPILSSHMPNMESTN